MREGWSRSATVGLSPTPAELWTASAFLLVSELRGHVSFNLEIPLPGR